jgi:hypothetical protein
MQEVLYHGQRKGTGQWPGKLVMVKAWNLVMLLDLQMILELYLAPGKRIE